MSSDLKRFVNFSAFVALIFVGIAILLGRLIPKISILADIGFMIAILVTAFSSFFYARSKRNSVFLIVWAIAFALVVVVWVLGVANIF